MKTITRDNLEAILDSGELFAAMRNGNWWRLRRNGKTQTWKRDPLRFRIPIKAGLRATGQLTETDLINGQLNTDNFRHSEDVPEKAKR
jgi:hypothetical protein